MAALLAALGDEAGPEAPGWYHFLKEAQYLHCPPWEMARENDPLPWRTIAFWRLAASVARDCENHTRRIAARPRVNPF
jgi:hypothetical protein